MMRSRALMQLARRVGLPGLAAIALLAFGAWGEFVACPEIEVQITELRDEARMRLAHKATDTTMSRPESVVAAVYDKLTRSEGKEPALAALLKRARAEGLVLETVHYGVGPSGLAGIVRHDISLPLKGTYRALHDWLASALDAQPSLGLGVVEFKRADTKCDLVEAQVTFHLWVLDVSQDVPRTAGPRDPKQHPLAAAGDDIDQALR